MPIDATSLGDAVTWFVCAVAAATVVRTVLGLVLGSLTALPGVVGVACATGAHVLTPLLVRRLLVGALGVSIGVAPAVASAAPASVRTVDRLPELDRVTPSPAPPSSVAGTAVDALAAAPDLDRGTTLERPPTGGQSAPAGPDPTGAARAGDRPSTAAAAPSPTPARPLTYVVRPDDTLWSIAARHLPAGASDVAIDREWRRWYRANRAVIGSDPDVIVPGQRLSPPQAR